MRRVRLNLRDISALRVGPESDVFEISDVQDLWEISKLKSESQKKVFVIGEGTNTYFGNNLGKYLFVQPNFKGINFKEYKKFVEVTAFASENWENLVRTTVEKKLWGLENLSFIPGSVGAAPVQNIGAYGQELKNVFVSCEVFDFKKNKFLVLKKKDCKFSYRDSVFKHSPGRFLIISVTLKLSKHPKPILHYKPLDGFSAQTVVIEQIRNLVIKTRRSKLPDYKIFPNSGSFFKNLILTRHKFKKLKNKYPGLPTFKENGKYKVPTAYLLDKVLGLKGENFGEFKLWADQPLVIVNSGVGEVAELKKLIDFVQEKFLTTFNLELEQEVNFVN